MIIWHWEKRTFLIKWMCHIHCNRISSFLLPNGQGFLKCYTESWQRTEGLMCFPLKGVHLVRLSKLCHLTKCDHLVTNVTKSNVFKPLLINTIHTFPRMASFGEDKIGREQCWHVAQCESWQWWRDPDTCEDLPVKEWVYSSMTGWNGSIKSDCISPFFLSRHFTEGFT